VGIYVALAVAFLIQPLIGMWRKHRYSMEGALVAFAELTHHTPDKLHLNCTSWGLVVTCLTAYTLNGPRSDVSILLSGSKDLACLFHHLIERQRLPCHRQEAYLGIEQ
jgi:hypothetical protein